MTNKPAFTYSPRRAWALSKLWIALRDFPEVRGVWRQWVGHQPPRLAAGGRPRVRAGALPLRLHPLEYASGVRL